MHSLDRLANIANHVYLGKYVKRLEFQMPQLPISYTMHDFEADLNERLIHKYELRIKTALETGDLTPNDKIVDPFLGVEKVHLPLEQLDLSIDTDELVERDHIHPPRGSRARYLANKYFNDVFPLENRSEFFENTIAQRIEEQRILCEDGGFAARAGPLLTKLPTATEVSISRGKGHELEEMIDEFAGRSNVISFGFGWYGSVDQKWQTGFVSIPPRIPIVPAKRTRASNELC